MEVGVDLRINCDIVEAVGEVVQYMIHLMYSTVLVCID